MCNKYINKYVTGSRRIVEPWW